MDKQKPSMNDKSAIHHDYYNDLNSHVAKNNYQVKSIVLITSKIRPNTSQKTFKLKKKSIYSTQVRGIKNFLALLN